MIKTHVRWTLQYTLPHDGNDMMFSILFPESFNLKQEENDIFI